MLLTTSRLRQTAAILSPLLLALTGGCVTKRESPNLDLRGSVAESTDSVALSPVFLTRQHDVESTILKSETVATEEGAVPMVYDPNFQENAEGVAQTDDQPETDSSAAPDVAPNITDAIGDFGGIPIIWPLEKGRLSSHFGLRKRRLHAGIDISAPRGTPVRAACAGQVLIVRRQGGYGKLIVIEHAGDRQTVYGHLDSFAVSEGDVVQAGETIGAVGRTGRATGYHLHFETRVGQGIPRDPLSFLPSVTEILPKISLNGHSVISTF